MCLVLCYYSCTSLHFRGVIQSPQSQGQDMQISLGFGSGSKYCMKEKEIVELSLQIILQ